MGRTRRKWQAVIEKDDGETGRYRRRLTLAKRTEDEVHDENKHIELTYGLPVR